MALQTGDQHVILGGTTRAERVLMRRQRQVTYARQHAEWRVRPGAPVSGRVVAGARTAAAGGRPQAGLEESREKSPTALDSTATTKRRWLPVDLTAHVSSRRTLRAAISQDLDHARSQVVVAHPGVEPGRP
jgi:hypothetical protein